MATPAAVEPRTACPACGGQVHPIAGRCKHCKADLTRLRGGAAPATPSGARPSLVALGGGNGHGANGLTHVDASSGAAPQPAPAPAVMITPVAEAADVPRASWSSRWPLLVAFIAVIAIIASIALLLFGGNSGKKDRGVRRFDGPAPELTPTDPLAPPPAPPAPPPNSGAPHAGIAPDLQPDPAPQVPAPPVPAPPAPAPAPTTTGPRSASDFVTSAVDVACRRLTSCSTDDQVAEYCELARQQLPQIGQTFDQACPDFDRAAAIECLDAVSRFPCPSGTLDPLAMGDTLLGLSGCQRVCPSAFAGMGGAVGGGSLGMTP